MSNQELVNEPHKPITRKLKKRKVYFLIKDNIWGVDLADMQLISKYSKGITFLLLGQVIFEQGTTCKKISSHTFIPKDILLKSEKIEGVWSGSWCGG